MKSITYCRAKNAFQYIIFSLKKLAYLWLVTRRDGRRRAAAHEIRKNLGALRTSLLNRLS